MEVFQSCRQCPLCRAGEYRRCEQHGLVDMYGFIPVDRAPGLWDGYAEYQYLAPDSMLLPIPAGRYPFANLPRGCVGFDDTEDLLATMADERDATPPVHGVFTP